MYQPQCALQSNTNMHLLHHHQDMMNPMSHYPSNNYNTSNSEPKLQDIDHPGTNDVMCGRGGGTNNHVGNIRFRQLVNGHKLRYLAATKSEKPMVAREVVTIWRGLNPPGRFLKQHPSEDGKSGLWFDVGDKKAREKASQCLRERTADVAPFIKKLELQIALQDEEEANRNGGTSKTGTQVGDDNRVSAAELSKELLKEQQEATIKAHMALDAFIPTSIVNALSPDQIAVANYMNNNQTNISSSTGLPTLSLPNDMNSTYANYYGNSISPLNHNPPNNNSQELDQQRERLAQEIAQLQQKQEQLEAMARMARYQMSSQPVHLSQQNVLQFSGQHGLHPMPHPDNSNSGGLPSAADLSNILLKVEDDDANGIYNNQNMYANPASHTIDHTNNIHNGNPMRSKEEYRKSVLKFMGSSSSSKIGKSSRSAKSSSGKSVSTTGNNKEGGRQKQSTKKSNKEKSAKDSNKVTTNNNPDQYIDLELPKGSYDGEFETRSHNSWMKGLHNFDDVSMSSSHILSPGSSVKNVLQGEDLEPEPIPTSNHYDSRGTNNVTKKSDRSLSSFEYAILDSMVSPTNTNSNLGGQPSLPNIYEDPNSNNPMPELPMPPPRSRVYNQKSNLSMFSTGSSSRPNLNEHNKEPSNISMLSDLTDSSLNRNKYSKLSKAKSDTSMGMSDNMSDLSEAMGSLDMK